MARKVARKPAGKTLKFYHSGHRARAAADRGPINLAAVQRDLSAALENADALVSYQKYLADARRYKAKRKTVSQEFERAVQANARRALGDMNTLAGTALRLTHQMTQAGLWNRTVNEIATGLGATGPISAKELWQDLTANESQVAFLRQRGVTDNVMRAVAEAMEGIDATIVLHRGKPAVAVNAPGGRTKRVRIGPMPTVLPRSVTEFLRRARFEQVLAAFNDGNAAYLEVVPTDEDLEYQLADLVATAAVATRERLAEHVRKLEDTGLATYAGRDPATVGIVFAIGVALAVLGTAAQIECDQSDQEDEVLCATAFFLLNLAVAVLVFAVAVGILAGGAGLILAAFAAFDAGALIARHMEDLYAF